MSELRPTVDAKIRLRTRILRVLLNALFALIVRRRIVGLENIPEVGGYVGVFNHLSNFDSPLLFSIIRRAKVTGLVAAEYRERPFHRFVVEAMDGMWLRRGASDRAALKQALDLLDQGWLVGMAPEGRRSPSKALIAGQPGPAFLALHAGVPVIPVAIVNSDKIASSLKRFRRITVTIRIGQPALLPPLRGGSHKQHVHAATDLIMTRLATLLPPEYRGVYAHQTAKDVPLPTQPPR